MLQKKVIDDLELRKYGFHVFPIDPYRTMVFPNGKSIIIWHDDHKTLESIRQISPHDADAWMRWMEFWRRAVRIINEFFLAPPPTLAQLTRRAQEMGEEEVLETLLMVPVKYVIERYFESPEVKTLVTPHMELGDITAPGSSYLNAYFRLSAYRPDSENYGIVRGGMGAITQSMARSAEAQGVSVRTNAEVKRILTKNGKATAVELFNGEVLESEIVISNADPKRTFLTLVDPTELDADFLADVRALKTNSASVKFLCALKELPDFSAYFGPGHDPKYLANLRILPAMENIEASWEDARRGRVSRTPNIELQIASVYDPTVSPQGHHVMSFWVYFQPSHPAEGSWAELRQEIGEMLIDQVSKYAPNLRDAIIDWNLLTPEDMEARIGLTNGNIRHVDMIPHQMLARRPLPGWSDYRTPIRRLYMCGAGTHPGGEVTGAPGHNAAHVIIKDLGLMGA
jgi:phytoene dehydrogenase-like protein